MQFKKHIINQPIINLKPEDYEKSIKKHFVFVCLCIRGNLISDKLF